MGKKSKGKHRLDKYYHLAKEQGYRSRAAFKLIQLNRKYDFLAGSRSLLDLCAAPGGWLQVAAKTMPVGSLIVGVDLDAIRAIRGCKTLVGDITTQKTRQDLKKMAGGNTMDTVIHDGAPNVGGVWSSEAYQQSWLVLEALKLASEFLAPKGTFITKIFRSQDYNALLYAFNQLFDKVDATKPAASRNTSAEIFVVCQGYKAPAKIDPRLLDTKYLFKETAEVKLSAGPDALLKEKTKQKRQREGYEEGISTTARPASAASFLASEKPVEALGHFTSFALDGPNSEVVLPPVAAAGEEAPAAEPEEGEPTVLGMSPAEAAAAVRSHPATNAEIRQLCTDLQVLGRSEFKALLKWRLQVRKDLQSKAAEPEPPAKEAAADDGGEDDKEEAIMAEMSALKEAAERRVKKEKKRKREAKTKARVRAAQMALGEGVNDGQGDEPMFSLASVRGRGAVGRIAEEETPDQAAEELLMSSDSDADAAPAADADSDLDSGDERQGYAALTEAELEDAYSQYQRRQGLRASAERKKRRRLGQATELDGNGSDSDEEAAPEDGPPAFAAAPADDDSEGEEGLLVKLDETRAGRPLSHAAVAAQWFAQDLFAAAEAEDDEQPPPPQAARLLRGRAEPAAKKARRQEEPAQPAAAAAGAAGAPAAGPPAANGRAGARAAPTDDEEFQVVPLSKVAYGSDSSDSEEDGEGGGSSGDESDFMENLDTQGKAEVMALAKRMLRRKSKDEIVEGAYNKYAFHDEGLPRWFAEDQTHHARAPVILTREELDAEKAELRAIDSRPIKKVAEAKARKRKRLSVNLEKARLKSEAIVGQEDIPMRSRMKEVEKVYARARAAGTKKGKGKETRSGKEKASRSGRPLDRRMMSDKREQNSKRKKAATKKRTKGKKPTGDKKR